MSHIIDACPSTIFLVGLRALHCVINKLMMLIGWTVAAYYATKKKIECGLSG